jgi:hypothetical protein
MSEPSLIDTEYWKSEDDPFDCVKENGENGNCPLNRKSCHGCRYNWHEDYR